jgi:hypothetical protein
MTCGAYLWHIFVVCEDESQPVRKNSNGARLQTRLEQGLAGDAEVANVPWSRYPEDYSAMVIHTTCIEHYKRGLLAYTMERLHRLKHLHWHKHQLPAELSANLAPMEVDFLMQYEQNLKKYADACGLSTDLSMDAAPPKSRCVQVCFCRIFETMF